MTLSLFVKDPGSALTHFIGMIMAAILAALPLLAACCTAMDSYHAVASICNFCRQHDSALWQPAPFTIPLISLKR